MRKTGWMALALLAVALGFTPDCAAREGAGETIDRLFDAYRAGSAERMLAIYSADATFEDVNQRHRFTGEEELGAMLAGIVGVHLRMDLEEQRRVVTGETVVVEYEYRGQLNGAALGASIGKEGCPDLEYTLPATSWYRVKDGRIVHQKDYIDWATFLDLRQQMLAAGSSPADGPSATTEAR